MTSVVTPASCAFRISRSTISRATVSPPFEPSLNVPILKFQQDIFNPNDCEIWDDAGNMVRKMRPEDCVGLERQAAWGYSHVEERLADHFAGRPSAIVERLKVKLG